jgi:hypothetical protein
MTLPSCRFVAVLTPLCLALIAGCANPVNRVTSDNYAETCAVAERNGRFVEMAINLGNQRRWNDGADYLARALPIADQFKANERGTAKLVLKKYGEELKTGDRAALAVEFEKRAATL